VQLFGKDLEREVVVVAEIGSNHEGDPEAARRMIRLAAQAGADAVKFQTFTTKRLVTTDDPDRLTRMSKFRLDEDAHQRLAKEAAEAGIAMFSTAVTEDVVPLLADMFPAIKIASGDLDFEPVIRSAAATGKPVIISTGLGDVDDVDRAVAWVADSVKPTPVAERLVLMHCVASYPAPLEEANLLSIPFLSERYGVPIGYSNHVVGAEAPLAAIALGASVIEVHFTDEREGRTFRDHHLSLLPDELADLVGKAQRIRATRGAYGKSRQPSELPSLWAIRKGLAAARDLEAGRVLTREDLMFARPATEFRAGEIDQVIGRRLAVAVPAGSQLRRAHLVDAGDRAA
jgi:N-acetylneuraminate synthase/N,N'-diacetyllegionaminate synthase